MTQDDAKQDLSFQEDFKYLNELLKDTQCYEIIFFLNNLKKEGNIEKIKYLAQQTYSLKDFYNSLNKMDVAVSSNIAPNFARAMEVFEFFLDNNFLKNRISNYGDYDFAGLFLKQTIRTLATKDYQDKNLVGYNDDTSEKLEKLMSLRLFNKVMDMNWDYNKINRYRTYLQLGFENVFNECKPLFKKFANILEVNYETLKLNDVKTVEKIKKIKPL